MKRFLAHVALFLVVLLLLATLLDVVVSSGIRDSGWNDFAEWNDILKGKAQSEIIILGSSRAWVHFSPKIIGSRLRMTCYNLGVDGYPLDMELARYALYRKYNAKPRVIVQEIDMFSLGLRADIYKARQFLPYFHEEIIQEAIRRYNYFKWYDHYLPLVRYRGEGKMALRGALEYQRLSHYTNTKHRGYQGMVRDWSDDLAEFRRENPDGVDQQIFQSSVDALDRFLATCAREGIQVVLVYTPEYVKAREVINNREEVFATYRSLAQKHGVTFLDYSDDPICYETKYFYNSQHMNKLGAELFSTRFAQKLAGLVHKGAAPAGQ